MPKFHIQVFLEVVSARSIASKAAAHVFNELILAQSSLLVNPLCEFLAKIPQHFKKIKKAQDFKFPKPDNPIASVEAFISAHYYENITAKNLCGICFLSESQLRRKFKSVYGTSPMQYLKNLRSTIAAKLLLQTDLSVGEISTRVGYTDVSVFYRHFVTIFGISPTEYKKRADSLSIPILT